MMRPAVPSGPMVGPFAALYERLCATDAVELTLTFAEIERLVGALPRGARVRRQWWTNNPLTPQARAWLYAGWKVMSRDLAAGVVHLRRVAGEVEHGGSGGPAQEQ
jgi:hypothetical protein